MQAFILNQGRVNPFVGWLAIDEFSEMLSRYIGAPIISVKNSPKSRWDKLMMRHGEISFEGCSGDISGDILIVIARSSPDLSLIRALGDFRKRFKKIVAWVADSYFHEGYSDIVKEYDCIAVTAHEDVDFLRCKYGVKAVCIYQGIDCYRVVSKYSVSRSIDLIGFGRLPSSYLSAFKARFHNSENPYLFLHSPIGSLVGQDISIEREMLFKLLQRSRISLAFHLFCEPEGNRPRSMMITSRWLESLAAGCLVVGKKPVSRMADDILHWKSPTIELSDDPVAATEEVQSILRRFSEFDEMRQEGVNQMLLSHDWRYRILNFAEIFELQLSYEIYDELKGLPGLAARCFES